MGKGIGLLYAYKYVKQNLRFVYILALFFWLSPNICFSQKDTSFWFGAPRACPNHEVNYPIILRLTNYHDSSTVRVEQPANPLFLPIIVNMPPYSAASVDLTPFKSMVETPTIFGNNFGYGLKITSNSPISTYYELGKALNPEIFVMKGKHAIGKNFVIPGQTRFANAKEAAPHYIPQPKGGFVIVATEDSTNITINLTHADENGHQPGVAFTISLKKGESYAVIAQNWEVGTHLGGSQVSSNKDIAITIYDDSIGSTIGTHRDIVGDQITQEETNGDEYIIVRGNLYYDDTLNNKITNVTKDIYYAWALQDTTLVYVNGKLKDTIMKRGQCYEGILADTSTAAYITTNHPVYLYQITGYGGEMASTNLPTLHCTGSDDVSFVRSTQESFQLNILCKTGVEDGFLLNGQAGAITPNLFVDVPATGGAWKAARINADNLPSLNQLITPLASTRITNSKGLFHLGFLNGENGTGSRLGFFSNYGTADITISLHSSTCIGDTLVLTANDTSEANSYEWTGPLGFTSSQSLISIPNPSYQNSGVYYLKTTIMGCGTTNDSFPITIFPNPTLALSPSKTICQGTATSIEATLLTGKKPWTFTYFNGFKDTLVTVLDTNVYSFPAISNISKTYSISQAFDANHCIINPKDLSFNTTITVLPLPKAAFNITPFPKICTNSYVQIVDESTPKGGIVFRQWNLNGVTANFIDTTLIYNQYDSGHQNIGLTVIDTNQFASNQYSVGFDVYDKPNLTLKGPYTVIDYKPLEMRPLDTLNPYYSPDTVQGLSYEWTSTNNAFLKYLSSTTDLAPTLTLPKGVVAADYTLTISWKDLPSCSATDSVSIMAVHTITDSDIPNVFTPNGDGVNDTWVIDHINDYSQAEIEVFNRYGQKVFESNGNKNPWDGRLNGKPLPMGVYYYIINLHNKWGLKSGWVTILR